MSELEKEPESTSEVEMKEPPSPKNQLVALLTLLPVLGILWLTIQYLPIFGDWMGEKANSVVSAVSGEGNADAKEEVPEDSAAADGPGDAVSEPPSELEPSVSTLAAPSSRGSVLSAASAKADFKSQITEQLGGIGKVEVRHIAVSDDGERMVAALKLTDVSGAGGLIEVFFDRDDFGRYLSSEDSPVPEKLMIWSE